MDVQVVQPQEGTRVVACAASRYEYELFSGAVVSTPRSEATNAATGFLDRLLKRTACQAVHELVVQTPDGESRAFRVGTSTAAVPAQVPPSAITLALRSLAAAAPLKPTAPPAASQAALPT